jgi:hypothetical protein
MGDLPLVAIGMMGSMFTALMVNAPRSIETRALLGALGLVILGLVLFVLWKRWRLYKAISFTTRHGVHVVTRGGQVVDPQAIEDFTDWLIVKWESKTPRWTHSQYLQALNDTILIWEPCPGHEGVCEIQHSPKNDFEDLIHPKEKFIRVCYHNRVKTDALAHAVGHVFLRNLLFATEAEQDAWMKAQDLP